jgi:TonB family protein
MAVSESAVDIEAYEPQFLLQWPRRSPAGWTGILSASVALHLIVFFVGQQVPSLVGRMRPEPPVVVVHKTILYLPPSLLTQKAPNTKKPSQNIDLQSLYSSGAPKNRQATPAPSRRRFEVPKLAQTPPVAKQSPQIVAQAPPVVTPQQTAQLPPGATSGLPTAAPPPAAAPVSQPFQNIGSDEPVKRPDKPSLSVPKGGVQGALQNLAQTPNGQHLVITDDSNSRPMPGAPGGNGLSAAQHSAVELQSDPQGADFRAYLAQVLAIVRSNWRRITPESVRLGTLRGRTVVEFIINRDGSIPKLVIATPANVEALDRASVAGLSMSNPLPPLPSDFKGFQVRLAFTFSYNMPNQ